LIAIGERFDNVQRITGGSDYFDDTNPFAGVSQSTVLDVNGSAWTNSNSFITNQAPGTIATTILYVDFAAPNIFDLLSVAAAIISALFVAWLVMRSSMWIIRHVGRTGILVLSRILGILLAALAIQFILNGIGAFVQLNWPGK